MPGLKSMQNRTNYSARYTQTHAHGRIGGQATVEFALVLTVLVLLIYGVLEVSRLVFINSEVDNAAREATRYAALTPGATQAALVSVVNSKMALGDPNSVTVTGPNYPDGPGNRCNFCRVQVTVTYQWTTLVPILRLGPLLLHSTSTALIENAGN
jgi:Flp pilus assembly protein TadG